MSPFKTLVTNLLFVLYLETIIVPQLENWVVRVAAVVHTHRSQPTESFINTIESATSKVHLEIPIHEKIKQEQPDSEKDNQ